MPDATHDERTDERGRTVVFRHAFVVRVTHWINAVCIPLLLVTGYFILLAHPRLYWGESGFFDTPALISIANEEYDEQIGWSRSVHFLCAWILAFNLILYLTSSLVSGHLRRDLVPKSAQLRWRHVKDELVSHLRLHVATGDLARHYNLLQRIAYLAVACALLPILILSGLTMSPAVTASFPELFLLFDGRQSARTVHFICAVLLLLFIMVHLWQVFLIGARDAVRGMIIGWYALPEEKERVR